MTISGLTLSTGTTVYNYNAVSTNNVLGEGRLASIDGPLNNDTVTYSYDELGRVTSRAINGSTNAVGYDSLGRVTNVVNALGSFQYAYTNTTARLNQITYPNGQKTTFDYFNNAGDQRLKQIFNKNSTNTTLSKFDYEYDVTGQITKWTQQADTATPTVHEFQYDNVDQLVADVLKNQSTSAILKRYAYTYDKSGNRTGEQIDDTATQSGYNNLNQLTSLASGGALKFKGSVSEPATVSVQSTPATVATNNVFVGKANASVGTNTISVIAQDYSSNARTNTYSVVVTNLVNRALLYDDNGNLTNDAVRSYQYDAGNRVTQITQGTNSVQFSYDGLGRRVSIANNGVTNKFLWCGAHICEQRDSAGSAIQKQFFPQGVRDNGTNYFWTTDHLGSIREVTDTSQTIVARYDYDPYGRRTRVSGSYDADFGFTGYYHLQPSWMAEVKRCQFNYYHIDGSISFLPAYSSCPEPPGLSMPAPSTTS